MMDISLPIGKMPKVLPKTHPKTRIPESGLTIEEQAFNMQRQAVIALMIEITETSHIIGNTADKTYYMMHLSPECADTLAALFVGLEDGDPLDAGEEEHDGREPDPEDMR